MGKRRRETVTDGDTGVGKANPAGAGNLFQCTSVKSPLVADKNHR